MKVIIVVWLKKMVFWKKMFVELMIVFNVRIGIYYRFSLSISILRECVKVGCFVLFEGEGIVFLKCLLI